MDGQEAERVDGVLNWLWAGIMLTALVTGACNGRLSEVTNALLSGGGEAIKLSLTLGGAMCLWGGMMRIAEKGGLTELLSRALAPLMRLLFPKLKPTGPACRAILMNMAANFLGLGNAATPLGIEAARKMGRRSPGTASDAMCMLVVCNTASIQLIPTTVATVRSAAGCAAPFDILPAVWLASALSVGVGILACKVFARVWRD